MLLEQTQGHDLELRTDWLNLTETRSALPALLASQRCISTSAVPPKPNDRILGAGLIDHSLALLNTQETHPVKMTHMVWLPVLFRSVATAIAEKPVIGRSEQVIKGPPKRLLAPAGKLAWFHSASSIHACWMADIFSPQRFASSSKPGNAITQFRKSTKLSLSGSLSGCASLSSIAISLMSVHFTERCPSLRHVKGCILVFQ